MNDLPGVPGLETARVLVVDDNRVNRHLLQALLERGGVTRIDMAEDGNDALARLDAFRPDLILLDLMMPNLDGFEMCRRLRAIPAWKDLPVLVQSSLNRAEDRAKAFAAGATDYVTKPINAVELLARVRIHLQNRALLHDLQRFHERTESELSLARKMQERLMPSPERLAEVEAAAGVGIAAHFAPSSELGGDFWDLRHDTVAPGQGRTMLYMVDFSGHGVGAALNTFRLHAICQQMDVSGLTPGEFLSTVNRRLCALLPNGQFATMLAGMVEPAENRFVYASAGSTRPMVWAPGDAAPLLGDSAGLPLGLLASAEYEERSLPLPPGGRLFLYSDGAIEIPVGNDVLDEPGLAALVAERMGETDGGGFLDGLLDRLRAVGPIDDDLTALLLTRKG
ncbi:fused response regulator/phosphatase [Azospirillum brasilense]|uniref:Fused response regulator/phosphatase n=1 Tax=Azospirillum brasilense TaxID=192 RepID=A0A0P0F1N1_AZOBR|nr:MULTISPECIES: fused response regulator/phosphatase [Azospirillum]ALJ34358.1 transcriptional regulator [Azospirillum brasilense]MDW7556399.1 fused response regulator/phosphatase [Azospirillum brasilense]MDW7596189.1 fused response regulator/phosphatase [Azospirillum brasilense]MDW7631162.1 fused response regulator/phosphatase [Azospirillum brasilense]MDX5952967.1 fused response regulator/phosphatase [Azospirillum brasilense]